MILYILKSFCKKILLFHLEALIEALIIALLLFFLFMMKKAPRQSIFKIYQSIAIKKR